MTLLSTTYLGPIQYYSKLISSEKIIIEKFEHYPKQTYRNRCLIFGANGPQTLTVPVTKGDQLKIFTKDIQIDYSLNWPKIHLKAIEAAYRCAPFYLYYIDDLIPFYKHQYTFLYDFNLELMRTLCQMLEIAPEIKETEQYIKNDPFDCDDFRDCIHPKQRMMKPDLKFAPPVYRQVFEPKLGFIPNLSIIDLIFNTGPDALRLLIKSAEKKAVP